jgi:hypothetical protein
MGNGVIVKSNMIRKMGYEAIFLQPNSEFVSSAQKNSVIIANNDIGFEWMGKMKDHRTYGIRVDDSAVQIRKNRIENATFGVLIYGYDYSFEFSDLEIQSNTIETTAAHGFNPRAVFVQGNRTKPVRNIRIANNSISLNGSSLSNNSELFFVADVTSGVIADNSFEIEAQKNGHELSLVGFDRENSDFCLYANKGTGDFDRIYNELQPSGNSNFVFHPGKCKQ